MPRGGQLWAAFGSGGLGTPMRDLGQHVARGSRGPLLLPPTLSPPFSSELSAEQIRWARTMAGVLAQLDCRVGWRWAGPLERVPVGGALTLLVKQA